MVRNSPCFLQRHLYHFFFHSFPMCADHRDEVYFFLIQGSKDPVCSEFTAKQCISLGVVFAFTYSVSAFITAGTSIYSFFFVFFFDAFSICPQLAAH